MPQLGPTELIIILILVLVLFGVGKIPEIGGALGKGVKEFRSTTKELQEAEKDLKEVTDLKKDEGPSKKV